LQLLKLYRKTQKTIDLLVDVQGYQMLRNNVFQGDPHPGR
jgi:predicted unusual protein kinase regulating ubiquinone biosynthesis (AarF/ABC1/UbiB family)